MISKSWWLCRIVCWLPWLAAPLAVADELPIVGHALSDPSGQRAFTFRPADFQATADQRRDLPIGVFDSGIGGLTVLEALLASDHFDNQTLRPEPDGIPDFQDESFVYFGDQANMPYGNYDAEGKASTLREHILKDTVFLLGRRYWASAEAAHPSFDKPPVKAIVIACNTATAYGLDDIRAAVDRWYVPIPVIGVVEGGARGLQAVWKEKSDQAVAVYATVGTCASGAYPRWMQSTLGLAGHRPAVITQQGSPDLAAAIEGTAELAAKPIASIVRADIRQLLDQHRRQHAAAPKPIGTIVLGCTHFPLVQSEIESALDYWRGYEEEGRRPFADWIAEEVHFVNPATWTARQLFVELSRARLRGNAGSASHRFFLSIPNPDVAAPSELNESGGFSYEYKYGREPGNLTVEDTRVVPMQLADLPASSQRLILGKLPHVAAALTSPAAE